MEILSPAGNKEALISAIRSGADAVYFGVGKFNARRNAENFSTNDLKDISKYCHNRGVKAYLALNTLVNDDEFDDAIKVVKSACEAGIDAIIVTDLGLANIIRKSAPNMPLHASTQMTIHNIDGIKFLKKNGFKRVVLARENSYSDLIKISEYAKKLGIETEIFVTGAHCMSISGQCLLSSVLGSRSGNRGLCAQPCRLPFKVKNGNGYDLSLKDMNLFEHFSELESIGIKSLKIEGRMKNAEYVAAATHSALCYKENRENKQDSLKTLETIFSRSGFTDGYFKQNINKEMFGIRSEQDIEKSKQIKNSIHELYRRERQNVGISVVAIFKNNKNSFLKITDGVNTVEIENEKPETANNKPTSKDEIISKLLKTGSTPYYIKKIDVHIDNDLFVSGKTISSLKTQAFEKLAQAREKINAIPFYYNEKTIEFNKNIVKTKLFISVHDLNQITDDLNCDVIFVPLSSNIESLKKLINKGLNLGVKTPVFYNELDINKLESLKKIGIKNVLVQNIGALDEIKKLGFITTTSPSINVFNSYSLNFIDSDYCTLSVELSDKQISKIKSNKQFGILSYGKLPLMIFKNCPIKANNGCSNCTQKIIDRKDIEFPVFCEDGITKMINNRPIFMAEKKDFLNKLSFNLLSFTDESPDEVKDILNFYKEGIKFNKEYTRGLYFKGVL